MAGDAGKTGAEQSTEKSSIGFSLPFAERAPANPMDVMAAATAAGMALTTQFANAFFGMMQAAMDATAKPAQPASPVAPKAPAQPAAPVVQVAETVKAEVKPVVVAKAAEPLAEAKPAVAAKPVAKVAKPKPTAKAVAATDEKPAVKAKVAKAAPVAKAKAEPAAAKPVKVAKAAKAMKAAVAPVVETPAAAKPQPRKKAAKAADDLKKISGIGPKLADMLGGMGVTRFAEIAAWTDKDVEQVDRELGLDGRIAKDNWIAQAKALLR